VCDSSVFFFNCSAAVCSQTQTGLLFKMIDLVMHL